MQRNKKDNFMKINFQARWPLTYVLFESSKFIIKNNIFLLKSHNLCSHVYTSICRSVFIYEKLLYPCLDLKWMAYYLQMTRHTVRNQWIYQYAINCRVLGEISAINRIWRYYGVLLVSFREKIYDFKCKIKKS